MKTVTSALLPSHIITANAQKVKGLNLIELDNLELILIELPLWISRQRLSLAQFITPYALSQL